MTEIQRLLSETIDDLNIREKRDNRPRFSISFIRKHLGLFIAMYAAGLRRWRSCCNQKRWWGQCGC